jgi:hypothetical protein
VFDAALADNPGDGLVMLVLIVANCSYEDARAEADRLEKAVGRWVRRRWFRGYTACPPWPPPRCVVAVFEPGSQETRVHGEEGREGRSGQRRG